MSAREVDINPNKDVGLKLPMTRSNKTGDFTTTKNSTQQSSHNINNLLLTTPGERVGLPTFGSNLRALCFEQIDDELPSKIDKEVRRSLERWLPYINVVSVETLTEDGDKSKIIVRVKYTTSLNRAIAQTTIQAGGGAAGITAAVGTVGSSGGSSSGGGGGSGY